MYMPASSVMRWVVALAAVIACTLSGMPGAAARSCSHSVSERMEVELVSVQVNGERVSKPSEFLPLDEVLSSSAGGLVLMREKSGEHGGRQDNFYELEAAAEPLGVVKRYIASQAKRSLMTSCGFAAEYAPILPGAYRLSAESVSDVLRHPLLYVLPGRDRVELEFFLGRINYVATFRVKCAYFHDGKPRRCAVSAVSPARSRTERQLSDVEDVAAPEASVPASAAAAPVPRAVAVTPHGDDATPASPAASTPPNPVPVATSERPSTSGWDCGACSYAEPKTGSVGWLLGLGLMWRLRARVRQRPTGGRAR